MILSSCIPRLSRIVQYVRYSLRPQPLREFHESKLVSQLLQQFLVISYHSALGALLTLLLAADRGLFSLPWFLTLERLYSGKESLGLVFCISPKRIHRIYIPPFSC